MTFEAGGPKDGDEGGGMSAPDPETGKTLRRQEFGKALTAALVVLNFRPEDIRETVQKLFEDSEQGRFFSHLEPRRIFNEIQRRLELSKAKAKSVEIQRPTVRMQLIRNGDTNVIAIHKAYGFDGFNVVAIVLRADQIRQRISDDAKAAIRAITVRPIANDTDPNSDETRLSAPMSVRMAMKGRLARIMAESAKAGAR